ncbi:uncharacterized protein LOC121854838 [Homarus americanus]|uniref:uncharacterized protein LOC121854838 n=1 Tax=Homarus americanus TaxID=6706 RepID=UPI001C44F637|nr:uncharacterized protein LOC121854838 [Homarus americanus]
MIMAHTNGTILEDLALNAEVTGIPNHTDYPVPYSALVDGTLGTRTSKYDCPTTEASKDPHITINLRQEKTITLIVVTASISHRAPNFKSLEIYVGNTGNYAQDSLITTTNTVQSYPISPTVPKGSQSPILLGLAATGQYITFHKTYSSGGSIALCHVQVYGE